jgi:TM2 domain-containing membrane protein YozV
MLAINMGANCFTVIIALITGQPYSNGLVPLGVAVHLITSTVIGAIFGLVINAVNKLRITGIAKGIGFGVATGLIAFVIIFLPIAMTVVPPKMMDLMKAMNSQMMMSGSNSKGVMMSGSSSSGMMSTNKMSSSSNTTSASGGMNEKSTMTGNSAINGKSGMMSTGSSSGMNSQMSMMPNMASLQSTIIGGSLLGHLVYGAVLGSIVTVLLKKTRRGEAKISK